MKMAPNFFYRAKIGTDKYELIDLGKINSVELIARMRDTGKVLVRFYINDSQRSMAAVLSSEDHNNLLNLLDVKNA